MSDSAMSTLGYAEPGDGPPITSSANTAQDPIRPDARFSRIEEDITLVVPAGCYASVLLKLVGHNNDHRYYAWWAMVGRSGEDEIAIAYNYTGEDTIRVDLPTGVPLSRRELQRQLTGFLHLQGELEGKPPIIVPDDDGLIDDGG